MKNRIIFTSSRIIFSKGIIFVPLEQQKIASGILSSPIENPPNRPYSSSDIILIFSKWSKFLNNK
jgi:hypothetical protein